MTKNCGPPHNDGVDLCPIKVEPYTIWSICRVELPSFTVESSVCAKKK